MDAPSDGIELARALAADGRRVRVANHNGEGHHETVALVDHETGAPFALLNFGDDSGELAAAHDLLERSDIRGRVITLDALHTTRRTANTTTPPPFVGCLQEQPQRGKVLTKAERWVPGDAAASSAPTSEARLGA